MSYLDAMKVKKESCNRNWTASVWMSYESGQCLAAVPGLYGHLEVILLLTNERIVKQLEVEAFVTFNLKVDCRSEKKALCKPKFSAELAAYLLTRPIHIML
jgi:hypothetical protein